MEDGEQIKLFVGGISWEATEDILKDHFAKYGTVLGSAIARDRTTGSPRGFAFVTFSESSAVDRALQDSHRILSRTVEVKRAIPRYEQQSQQLHQRGVSKNNNRTNSRNNDHHSRTKKIFVGGLSANLTQEEFQSYFEKFGRITDVVVMHDNTTHRPRGFGFITFDSEDSVEEVMQNKFHELNGKHVEVKRAVPKDGISGSSSSSGYNGRLGSGRGSPNFNFYQQGCYSPYNTRVGNFPSGYGNVTGYPYGAGIFGSHYPSGGFGGVGYGFNPILPTGPWNTTMICVRGGLLPYGSAPPVYPTYMNSGYGVVGFAANGYGGIMGAGFGRKSGQMGIGDAQNLIETSPSPNGMSNADGNSIRPGKGARASAWKQNKKGNDRSHEATHSS